LRVITVERPGFGNSTAQRGRTIIDWPADLAALADHLQLARFQLAGFSGAGPFLYACAWALPDRIERALAIGCAGPLHAGDARGEMAPLRRAFLALLQASPEAAARAVGTLYAIGGAHWFFRAMTAGLAPVDREALRRPGVWERQLAGIKEALRPGMAGFLQEIALLAGPWGFPLEAIRVPVEIWHGTADASTPRAMAEHAASLLRDARFHVLAGAGHFLILDHAEAILGRRSSTRPDR
jgi:pimeloyl-ACP methyl ester carboxylesterase